MSEPFVVFDSKKFRRTRLVESNGEYHDDINVEDALALARSKKMDLVCFSYSEKVSTQAEKPLCKIVNFGKWKYDKIKEEKHNRKNQKIERKEIRFSPFIASGDIEHKLKNIRSVIDEGGEVTLVMETKRRLKEANVKVEEIMSQCREFSDELSRKTEGNRIVIKLSSCKKEKEI